jgi:hypothetical protein
MENSVKMSKFKKSWLLTQGAWRALKLNKRILILPVIGMLASLVVIISAGAIGFFAPDGWFAHRVYNGPNSFSLHWAPLGFVGLASMFICIAGLSAIISGAVTSAALERLNGGKPTIKSSLKAARKRWAYLAAFGIFSSVIGYALSEIANRIPFLGGKIVAWLANATWSVASFFAIPVIMSSETGVNPIKATKQSTQIIKKAWGESLITTTAIGLVSILAILGYMFLIAVLGVVGMAISLTPITLAVFVPLAILGFGALTVTSSVLDAFVKAALYHYATTGESPVMFNQQLLREAFTRKKARKIFG